MCFIDCVSYTPTVFTVTVSSIFLSILYVAMSFQQHGVDAYKKSHQYYHSFPLPEIQFGVARGGKWITCTGIADDPEHIS